MSVTPALERQDWVSRCALELGTLVPSLLSGYIEELTPAFVRDWADAIWADTLGGEPPEAAAWDAVNEVRRVKAARAAL
jgi:hypothetical protein